MHSRNRPVSIHAFRGEGDRSPVADVSRWIVSIHAFRGEGDVRIHIPVVIA